MVTLAELATLVGGVCVGDTATLIRGVAPTHSATTGDITFLDSPQKLKWLQKSAATAAVISTDVSLDLLTGIPMIFLRVENPLETFEILTRHFTPPRPCPPPTVSPRACVSDSAVIGKNTYVGPLAIIGDDVVVGDNCHIHSGAVVMAGSKIGNDTRIFPNVVLYENTIIGDRCIIHANTSIGAFGFGYDSRTGQHILSAQLGNVVIGNDVEIGACSTIDRATHGSTRIGDGTKIDNLVMIAHNCRIGKHNMICAHTGIAGSTTTGDHVVMAGRVGIRDHVHIGNQAVLGAMAGIMNDVPDKARVVGIPATPEKEQMRLQVALAGLPQMRRELKELQRKMEKLEKKGTSE